MEPLPEFIPRGGACEIVYPKPNAQAEDSAVGELPYVAFDGPFIDIVGFPLRNDFYG